MKDFSITLQSASVEYPINQPTRLKDFLSRRPAVYTIKALSNINLVIQKGERVGLIGHNGAGKSTLLKLIAKIYQPTQGVCRTIGHVCPLFEFATGFEMDMTGWENIRIRAMLLGMSRREIKDKIQEIAEFTELGHFLNYPVRTYSSGMFIRLAFAISTSITPEILLLDEIIGAGDASFSNKARKRTEEFMEKGRILILSTHSPSLLKEFCERTIWLKKGNVEMDGPTDEVWEAYIKSVN